MSGDEMESWYWSELLDLAPDDVHEEVMRRVELLEAENAELKRLIKWIDGNRHADWPFATFNLEEWEKQRGP